MTDTQPPLPPPHSINSPYCRKEIELAIKRNKRIIPLLHHVGAVWKPYAFKLGRKRRPLIVDC